MKHLLILFFAVLSAGSNTVDDGGCICDVSPSGHIANCEYRNLTSVPDCVPREVQMLLVSGNPLLLNKETFHRFENLTKLIMRKVNGVNTHLPGNLFSGNPYIEWISMGWNNLKSLPNNLFAGLLWLKNLDLWANELTEIPLAVRTTTSLEILTLDRNKIETLDVEMLAPLSSLKRLSLRRNPLRCDCGLQPVFQWAQERNVTHVLTAQCETPDSLQGRTLLYAFSSMDCELSNDLALNLV
ncbi:leucine-rich repeat-containing protein 38-like [Schistocerca piceifrons]|uniref:leucine-rich repeat-containing protein 38-like n=1 Tax=Schistocerca piceifrons TaxID=274613 RepID=UPI001F5E5FB4|nr:leucine-rich repeat-containing protein 38-like [Schistocerca piceifrons]